MHCTVSCVSVDTNDIVKKNPKATLNVLWNVLRALTIRNLRMMTGQRMFAYSNRVLLCAL